MTVDFKIDQLRVSHLIGENTSSQGKLVVYTNRTSGSSLYSGTISDTQFLNQANASDVSIAVSSSRFAVGMPIFSGSVTNSNTGVVLFTGDTVVSGTFIANSRLTNPFLAISSSLIGVDGFTSSNDTYLISNSFIAASRNISIHGYEAPPQPSGFVGFHTVLGSYGMEITSSNHVAAINAVSYIADSSSRNVVTRSFGVTLIGTAIQNVNGGRNVVVLNDYSGTNEDDQILFAANNVSTATSDNFAVCSIGNYESTITGGFGSSYLSNYQATIIGGTSSFFAGTQIDYYRDNNTGISLGSYDGQKIGNAFYGIFKSNGLNLYNTNTVNSIGDFAVQISNSSYLNSFGNVLSTIKNSSGSGNMYSLYLGNGSLNYSSSTDDFIFGSRNLSGFNTQRCRIIGNSSGSLRDSSDIFAFGYGITVTNSNNVFTIGRNWQLSGRTNLLAIGSQTTSLRTVVSSSLGVDFATGSVNFNEGISYKPLIVTGSTINLTKNVYLVGVSGSGSSINVYLPSDANFGQQFVIKDIRGNASASNIIIQDTDVLGTIDNSTTYTLAINFASVTVCLFTKSLAGANLWGVI